MVSPNNDHQNPSFPPLVRQDSLNNLNLNDKFHIKEEEEPLFIQNPSSSSSSSSSSTSIVLGNIDLKEPSCKTSIQHVWDEILQENATNNNMCFQEQFSLGETPSYEQVLVPDGNVNDHHSMEISPQPLMSIDPMAMNDSPSFKVLPEISTYLDDQQLLGFPALPLQVERKRCKSTTKEPMEKSMERRQRRMIKNRESAARSRARKQAHTTMLEKQVSELRSRNNWLKKLKEAEMVLNSDQQAGPRYQLRRTTSSTF